MVVDPVWEEFFEGFGLGYYWEEASCVCWCVGS